VPSGSTKVIQPFETGVVRSIRVEDGHAVKAGDDELLHTRTPGIASQ